MNIICFIYLQCALAASIAMFIYAPDSVKNTTAVRLVGSVITGIFWPFAATFIFFKENA